MKQKVLVELCRYIDLQGLILEIPTGVYYTNQTGGHACNHPQVEGVYMPFPVPIELRTRMINVGSLESGISQEEADELDSLLLAYHTELKVDRERLLQVQEAWLPVQIRNDRNGYWEGCKNLLGTLTWGNSD